MKKLKIFSLYVVALVGVFSICVSAFFIVRNQYNKKLQEIVRFEITSEADCELVVSELSSLLSRSYFFSDKMMLDAYTKLNECYQETKSYLSSISACLYSVYSSRIYGDDVMLGESLNRLADYCMTFDAPSDAEYLYKSTLMLAEEHPQFVGGISARAHWGLAKVCAETGLEQQALDHIDLCLNDAPEEEAAVYQSLTDLIVAEIQYRQGSYEDCVAILKRFERTAPAEAKEMLMEYTLPLLSLQGLAAAQNEDYALSSARTDELIDIGCASEHYSAVGAHLSELRSIYEHKGLQFPKEYEDTLIMCYKTNLDRSAAFIAQYSILEYTEYTEGSEIHYEIISQVAWIALLVVIIVSNTMIKLYMNSRTDPLTKLYNKGYFINRFRLLQRGRRNFALIMFDVDKFKNVNDSYGHEVGDKVLIRVAKQLERRSRPGCTAFRVGGEEFCVLIRYIKKYPPYRMAEEIRASVEALKWQEDMKITVSAGVAVGKKQDLYKIADERLYFSKENGRNQVN